MHPEIYNILRSDKDEKRIQRPSKSGWEGDLFGLWDIVTMPEEGNIYLIQSKTKFNPTREIEYFNKLLAYKVPMNVKKQLFIWEDKKISNGVTSTDLKILDLATI